MYIHSTIYYVREIQVNVYLLATSTVRKGVLHNALTVLKNDTNKLVIHCEHAFMPVHVRTTEEHYEAGGWSFLLRFRMME